MKHRLVALDWMRGAVIILMAVDHASAAYNRGRLLTDSFFLYIPGMALPSGQFWTRWITHICAPTFLFLAGTALALSIERRAGAGEQSPGIDRYLLTRGLIIALLDPLFISWFWVPGYVVLQVLYAIGLSLILMIPLRRLRTRWLLTFALGILILSEVLTAFLLAHGPPTLLAALPLHGGFFRGLVIVYPVLPWLAMMVLGWAFGRYLLELRQADAPRGSPLKVLGIGSLIALSLFLVIRGVNGYGNMMLPREDGSLIQWLHISKYPPSLAFTALELGLMGLGLILLMLRERRQAKPAWRDNPVLVFGQTALFFYLLHIPMLEISSHVLGVHMELGLAATYVATAGVLIVLYPCCRWYRRYKAVHPHGWVRYI